MDLETAAACWQKVVDQLETAYPKATVNTYFRPLTVFYVDDRQLILKTSNAFDADHINQRYQETLRLQCNVQFDLRLDTVKVLSAQDCDTFLRTMNTARLNPKFTFDSFVTGQSNLMAYSAAQAVAEHPGQSYNPLFLWGGAGLGKTHLMTAIANEMLRNNPRTMVQFYSSEQFTNEVVEAIRQKTTNELRSRLRSTDILFVDDIQLLAGRNATQEEFFNTFNDLHARGKQIVISADKPPESIPTLEERMRSRFKSGIVMCIDKPDFETRCAILRNKAAECGYRVEPDAIDRIAERVDTNIRELEGCLKTCDFLAQNMGRGIVTLDIVERQLGSSQAAPAPAPALTSDILIDEVAEHLGVSREDVLSKRRSAEIAAARHMAIYLISELLGYSTTRIGQIFGRDHSTVMSSIEKAKSLMSSDSGFADAVKAIRVENGK